MSKHLVFDLISSFNKKQVSEFELFLKSPYHNKSQKAIQLYRELVKFYPDFSSEKLTKENLSNALYGSGKYKDSTVRNLLAHLMSLGINFVGIEAYKNDKCAELDLVLEKFMIGKQKRLFDKYAHIFENDVLKKMKLDENFFMHEFSYRKSSYYINRATRGIKKTGDALFIQNLITKAGESLIFYFIIQYGWMFLNLIAFSYNTNLDIKKNLLLHFFNSMDLEGFYKKIKQHSENAFLVELFIYAVKTLSLTRDESSFFKYKDLIIKHYNKLSQQNLHIHYIYLENYLLFKCVKNEKKYLRELFEMHKLFLVKGFYKFAGKYYFGSLEYIDILEVSLANGETQWAAEFMNKYESELSPADRVNTANLAQTKFNLHIGKYELALKYLNSYKPDDFMNSNMEKSLRILIFYELGYFAEAGNLLMNFKRSLTKGKIGTPIARKRYINFISIAKKMVAFNLTKRKNLLSLVRKEFSRSDLIINKNWLRKKLKLLK